jgi:hypothetical protein
VCQTDVRNAVSLLKGTAAQASVKVLDTYVPIWQEKHSGAVGEIPDSVLANSINSKRPALLDLSEGLDLDPADTEFKNGLLEFYRGALSKVIHSRYTAHFATAIRSAVTARQINRWLQGHPIEFAKWRSGRGFDGPTFLDDEAAAEEAQAAWKFVDHLLKEQHVPIFVPFSEQLRLSKQIARLYQAWEESVL